MGILIAYTGVVKWLILHIRGLVIVGLSLLWVSARADRTDFKVNSDGNNAEQNAPRIAVTGDGSFVITWVDKRDGSADIYLQRYLTDGAQVGSNLLVNDDSNNAYQIEPALAVDLSGLYSLVWKDYRTSSYPFDPDIFFQRFDTAVAPVGVNLAVTVEQPDSLKESPDIALSPWGGGVVVWADYRNLNWDIYGQLITSDGNTVGSNFLINDDALLAQQHAPRVAVSPEGWFVVTWYDNRNGNDDIFAQRFDSLANPLGANLLVNSDINDKRQAFPDVACDGAGHFTVVWVDWRNGVYPANPDIYTRKYDTTLTPVAGDARVNSDGTSRAQRQPCIAADRQGNVAIIWSDSSGTAQSYDIRGQMVDVDGVIREVNFQANSEADSAQLNADVALDGRYRYVTWADKRNGNYDIYASITKYNDPSLMPTPGSFRFEMLEGDAVPAAQSLRIDHVGYNAIGFQAVPSHDWLAVTPGSGTTSATLDVSINTDTLPYGTYLAAITLIDTQTNDSTVQVSVRFDVTAPVLQLSSDSLTFDLFAGVPDSTSLDLSITNAGSGQLIWSITETIDWLRVESMAGVDSAVLPVWGLGEGLSVGTVVDSIQVTAGGAINSPRWVKVVARAINDQPYIDIYPDSIRVATKTPDTVARYLSISNLGVGTLAWSALEESDWLVLDRTTGVSGDSIGLSINTSGLLSGLHVATVDIIDSNAFRPSERFTLVLDYLTDGEDTVVVNSAQATTGSVDSVLVQIRLKAGLTLAYLPFSYDPGLVTIDSARPGNMLPSSWTAQVESDSAGSWFKLSLTTGEPGDSVAVGEHDFAWVYFTAGDQAGRFDMLPIESAANVAALQGGDQSRRQPVVVPGEVVIDEPTSVEDPNGGHLPGDFALHQNYPNPFNPSTTIEFTLPQRSEVELEIFNILGQRVRQLVEEELAAGAHKVLWDGRFGTGQSVPSGIYFYRLRAANNSSVRKMVLVK